MANLVEKICPICDVNYSIPLTMDNSKKKNGGSWYCPNGHELIFTENTADRLKKELDQVNELLSQKNGSLNYHLKLSEGYRNTIRAYKGHVTRLKK